MNSKMNYKLFIWKNLKLFDDEMMKCKFLDLKICHNCIII